MLKDEMTIGEVADYLKLSKQTLKAWDKSGHLKADYRVQKGWQFDRRYKKDTIINFIERNTI
jgi:excisionase family DNA binding protein